MLPHVSDDKERAYSVDVKFNTIPSPQAISSIRSVFNVTNDVDALAFLTAQWVRVHRKHLERLKSLFPTMVVRECEVILWTTWRNSK